MTEANMPEGEITEGVGITTYDQATLREMHAMRNNALLGITNSAKAAVRKSRLNILTAELAQKVGLLNETLPVRGTVTDPDTELQIRYICLSKGGDIVSGLKADEKLKEVIDGEPRSLDDAQSDIAFGRICPISIDGEIYLVFPLAPTVLSEDPFSVKSDETLLDKGQREDGIKSQQSIADSEFYELCGVFEIPREEANEVFVSK